MSDKTRIIIAGSRSVDEYWRVEAAMSQVTAGGANRGVYEIVSGGAEGVDQFGERWAEEYDCDVTRFEPDWEEYGNAAGPIRNGQMAKYADKLVAVWDGESAGTRDMIDKALDEGLDTHVFQVDT